MKTFFPKKEKAGFTLIEVMVSVTIFSIVMIVAVGSLYSVINANRKAKSLSLIVNNLNLAFESMIRDLRTGSEYDVVGSGEIGDRIDFKDKNGDDTTYYLSGNTIQKIEENGVTGAVTSDEVTVEDMEFRLIGGGSGDGQPIVLLHIKGAAGDGKTSSEFNIQTLITSRTLDNNELP